MQRTVSEIADELRAHLNADNAAKQHFIDHILPLVGIDVDTVTELDELAETPASYSTFVEDIGNDLYELIRDFSDLTNDEILAEIKRIRGSFV